MEQEERDQKMLRRRNLMEVFQGGYCHREVQNLQGQDVRSIQCLVDLCFFTAVRTSVHACWASWRTFFGFVMPEAVLTLRITFLHRAKEARGADERAPCSKEHLSQGVWINACPSISSDCLHHGEFGWRRPVKRCPPNSADAFPC